jgi:endonuclease III
MPRKPALREVGDAPTGDATASRGPSVSTVLARLRAHYGAPAPRRPNDPLAELVQTILSQHTSDINTERAYASLVATFGSWDAIRTAPTLQVADAIRAGGLARVKAPRIIAVLESIYRQHGRLSLDFLADMETEDARRYLTALGGVGPKTAACVLLFACNKPTLPVDTHVYRVSRRLGLIGSRTPAARAHVELEARLEPADVYAFHMLLIGHGRATCRAVRPRCSTCPVGDVCPRVGVRTEPER